MSRYDQRFTWSWFCLLFLLLILQWLCKWWYLRSVHPTSYCSESVDRNQPWWLPRSSRFYSWFTDGLLITNVSEIFLPVSLEIGINAHIGLSGFNRSGKRLKESQSSCLGLNHPRKRIISSSRGTEIRIIEERDHLGGTRQYLYRVGAIVSRRKIVIIKC